MYVGLTSPLTINGLDNVTTGADTEYSITKYGYNQLGKLISKIDPSGKEESYTYDLNGTLLSERDRSNSLLTYSYDILQRLTGKSVITSDGTGNEAYNYGYYITGSRKSMSGGGTDTSYIYDDLGRLVVETESNGITKEYTYDANNNRKSFVIKQSNSIISNTTYDYDSMNRLSNVNENGQLVATYTYDANGNRDTMTYGNGVSIKYDYNNANKLKTLTNKNSVGAVLSQFSYSYYLDGNQATKTDTDGVTNYKYDGLGRISTVEGPNGLFKKYGYDDKNNRTDLTATGETFEGSEDMSFSYDGFNQLKTVIGNQNTSYSYNADGMRNVKVVDGVKTTQVLDGENVAVEISKSTTTKYVRGVNLICQEKNGQRYYYLYNGHGDLVQVVDASGNVVNSYQYDEWGNIVSQSEGIENPFKYAGEYFDKETGLYYLRIRYYDPTIGRFISEDSYPGEANNPLSLNLYTYCVNNPINLFDPSGNFSISIPWGEVFKETVETVGKTVGTAVEYIGKKATAVTVFIWVLDSQRVDLNEGEQEWLNQRYDETEQEVEDTPEGSPGESVGLPNQGTVEGNIPGAPPVDAGKQGKHVPGHNNNNRNKSQWPEGETGVDLTQEAWQNGTPVKPDGSVRIWDTGKPIGPNGETRIKVHQDTNGNIHGYPVPWEGYMKKNLLDSVQKIYKEADYHYIVSQYIDINFWTEKLKKYFNGMFIENLTDFNYSTCFTFYVNISNTNARVGTSEFTNYVKENNNLYRLLIQISILAPYAILKYVNYTYDNKNIKMDTSINPFKQEHISVGLKGQAFLSESEILILDEGSLSIEIPDISLELRESNVTVYNCLFEDEY